MQQHFQNPFMNGGNDKNCNRAVYSLKLQNIAFQFLALMPMKPFLFLSICVSVLAACNNNTGTDALYSQEPFKNVSDSIKKDDDNAALYYRRGTLLYQNDQKEYAEKDLKKAWELQPTEEHALSVVTVLVDKDPNEAIAFIEDALKKLPKSISLQVSLARGYQQQANAKKALQVVDQLLAQHPNSLDALLLKSDLLKQEGKDAEALETLETAYAYAPFDVELSYNLAFEYAEAKNAKALAITDALIKRDTSEKHAEPYYLKGVYYENIGNTEQAINFYNQAIQHDYYFIDAYADKGKLLYNQKKYDSALQTFQLSTRITPTFAEGYFWAGKCYEALNKKADAKLNYQRAYGLDKNLTEAKDAAAKL
jgi:tetratricopeptide (TPR) repeat protein